MNESRARLVEIDKEILLLETQKRAICAPVTEQITALREEALRLNHKFSVGDRLEWTYRRRRKHGYGYRSHVEYVAEKRTGVVVRLGGYGLYEVRMTKKDGTPFKNTVDVWDTEDELRKL